MRTNYFKIRWLRLLFLSIISSALTVITAYGSENIEVGGIYTIQNYPYFYNKSEEFLKFIEENPIERNSMVTLKEVSSWFNPNVSLQKTIDPAEIAYYYIGDMKKSKPDGKGMLLKNYGSEYGICYVGDFSNGYQSGFGIEYEYCLDYASKNNYYQVIYEGEFKKGKRTGKGCKYYNLVGAVEAMVERAWDIQVAMEDDSNESQDNLSKVSLEIDRIDYISIDTLSKTAKSLLQEPVPYISKHIIGEWENGKANGNCDYYDVGDYLFASGKFKDDLPNGKVTVYYPYSDNLRYKGETKKGEYNGKGELYFESGEIKYKGDFKDNEFSGNGILYNENGDVIHDGKFKDGDIKS